jgi:bifunctional DNA-binding transcriptional regulator/antitoxin component of YhaV-PrlF toxin-antitoxin module
MPSDKFNLKKLRKDLKKRGKKIKNKLKAAESDSDEENEEIAVVQQKETNMSLVHGVEKNTYSRADNIVASAISSSSFIDIDLKTNLLGQLLGQTMKLVVQNNNADPITPPDLIQETLDFIWLKLNGANLSLMRMDKETLMYPLRFLDEETLTRLKRGYEGGDPIPAGGQRTYYVPLLGDPFVLNNIFMQAIKGGLQYNVHFDKNAWINGYPDVVELSMISRHTYHSEPTMKMLRDDFRTESNLYNFRSFTVQKPTESITPGQVVEIKLDGFKHKASDVIIQIYQAGQKLTELADWIDRYDITDANNVSLISSGPIDKQYDDVILGGAHDHLPVIGALNDSWTVISFSPEMAEDFLTGSVNGHRQFTGDEVLKLTISPDLPDNSYKCKIYFGKLDRMESNGGVFRHL